MPAFSWIAVWPRRVRKRWSRRPWLAFALASLCLLMTLSGPAACVAHCFVVDAAHQEHRHAHGHPAASIWSTILDDPCLQGHASTPLPEHHPPSALTIAVITPMLLLPYLLSVPALRINLRQRARDVWLLPPDQPPRCRTCAHPASL